MNLNKIKFAYGILKDVIFVSPEDQEEHIQEAMHNIRDNFYNHTDQGMTFAEARQVYQLIRKDQAKRLEEMD